MSTELMDAKEVILGFTDGEYDDWGAVELLRMVCNNTGRKLVLVLCYRSQAILEQMASDMRRLLPGVTVLMGPEDEGRDGGYPMDAPHDGLATPRFREYPANTRMIFALSLLDAMLLPFPNLWMVRQAPNHDADVIAECFVSIVRMAFRQPALFIYGGGYNLRTPVSKALFDKWKGEKASFDGWPAFGNRTNLYQSGPYIQALQQKKADGSAIAAHILHVGETWNKFLSAKFTGEITEWYMNYCDDKCQEVVLEPIQGFIDSLLEIEGYLAFFERILSETGDTLTYDNWQDAKLECIIGGKFFSTVLVKRGTLAHDFYGYHVLREGVRLSDSLRTHLEIGRKVVADAKKYWNKLRILKEMQADPLQGCTADMFAALLAVLYRPGVGTIGASFRLALSIDEEKKVTERFSASGAKRIARCNDELREVFREEMEALAAEAIRTDGASLGTKIPVPDS